MNNTIDIEAYKKVLHETLDPLKKMCSLLGSKMILLDKRIKEYNGDLHQRNDDEIALIETETKLKTHERILVDKQKYLELYIPEFEKDANECNRDFDFIITCAKSSRSKDKVIDHILTLMDRDPKKLEEEPEIKLGYYKSLKKRINNEGKVD